MENDKLIYDEQAKNSSVINFRFFEKNYNIWRVKVSTGDFEVILATRIHTILLAKWIPFYSDQIENLG